MNYFAGSFHQSVWPQDFFSFFNSFSIEQRMWLLLKYIIIFPLTSSFFQPFKIKFLANVYGCSYVVRCAIWYHLYNLKNVKNTHGGVLLQVKLQAAIWYHLYNLKNVKNVFFTFFKLYKWHQIASHPVIGNAQLLCISFLTRPVKILFKLKKFPDSILCVVVSLLRLPFY